MLPTYHMKDRKQAQTLSGMWHLNLKLTGHTPKLDDLKNDRNQSAKTSTITRAIHSFTIIQFNPTLAKAKRAPTNCFLQGRL